MKADQAREAFKAACAAAQFDASTVRFVPFAKDPTTVTTKAAFLWPGQMADVGLRSLLDLEGVEVMRDLNHHRIVCWTGIDDRLVGPVLRHEIEHVIQWNYHDEKRSSAMLLGVGVLYTAILKLARYQELPAHGQVYNLNPIELDANGAGARYAFSLLGQRAYRLAALNDETLDPSLLRRRPEPEPLSTLATRLICFACVWADEVVRVLSALGYDPPCREPQVRPPSPPAVATFFDQVIEGGGALWLRLGVDPRFKDLRKTVHEVKPSPQQLPDVSVTDGWRNTREAVGLAVNRAREVAGLGPTPQVDDEDAAMHAPE